MKDIKSIVANNLGVLRKQRGITQAELAEKLAAEKKAMAEGVIAKDKALQDEIANI